MHAKHFKELIAMAMIGEGVIATVCPEGHTSLWRVGPTPMRKIASAFAHRPNMTRIVAAAEAGIGLWWALRQLPEPVAEESSIPSRVKSRFADMVS